MDLYQFKKQAVRFSLASLILLGLLIILVNVISTWISFRIDLTGTQAYSLSPASKKLARSLDDTVLVKAYFTPDLPPPYNAFSRYTNDLLTEYRVASKGKLHFEFVPSVPTAMFEQKALEAGMQPIQFEETGNSQLQIRRGFMGITLFYRNKNEVIPLVKGVDGLEYDITSRLARMTQKSKKVIALTAGHGESDWQTQMRMGQELGQLYDFKTISLALPTTGAFQADALIVGGPQQPLDPKSLWVIDQAIMRGIPTAFFVDTKKINITQFTVNELETGLDDLLQNYGVQLGKTLVYDQQCETVAMSQNMSGFSLTTNVQYPFVPVITQMEKDQPLLRGLDRLSVPFVAKLEAISPLPQGVQLIPLLWSSRQSWEMPSRAMSVAPNAVPTPGLHDPSGPFMVGGLLQGTLPSYFQNKQIPFAGTTFLSQSPKTTVVVIPTAQYFNPNLPDFSGNIAFITNVLAFLAKDETLLGVRAKGDILKPLKPVSAPVREGILIFALLGIPVLPVVYGLLRWRRRDKRRMSYLSFVAHP